MNRATENLVPVVGRIVALLCAAVVIACGNDGEDGITEAVEAALEDSADVDAREVDVSVDGDTVVLRGDVETLLARQEAVALARAVPGVATVVDRLELEPYVRSDDVIERRVAQALMVDPGTELTLDVDVAGGIVRLRGFVPTPSDIVTARQIAASVRGVEGVVDEMRARPLAAR